MTLKSNALKYRAIGLASLVIMTYVTLLLVTTWVSQGKMREAAVYRIQNNLNYLAESLNHYYVERHHELTALLENNILHNYFINRDLGMSLEYGLNASLLSIRHKLNELHKRRVFSDNPAYLRLALLDIQGNNLADTAPDSKELYLPTDWNHAINAPPIQFHIIKDQLQHQVLLICAVQHKGQRVGTLVAWTNNQAVFKHTVKDSERYSSSGDNTKFIMGMAQDQVIAWNMQMNQLPEYLGKVKPLMDMNGENADRYYQFDQTVAITSTIPETPFWMIGFFPSDKVFEYLSSNSFFIALSILMIGMMIGTVVLFRSSENNLVLSTKIEESNKQRKMLHDKNIQLEREINKRKKYETDLFYQANYDKLTKLPNRALAMDRLAQTIKRAERELTHVMVIFLDLDRFKEVNDSLGHEAGDLLLQEVANRLSSAIRSSDTVSRLGGDEFLLIIPDMGSSFSAEAFLLNLMKQFAPPFFIDGHELFVTASLGVVIYPDDGGNSQLLIKNADVALYKAKDAGRQTFRFFTSAMNREVQERLSIETQLRYAIEREEFELRYQPIIDFTSGKIVCAEALLRWYSHELGTVPPMHFIPLAEEMGYIQVLGEWVLQRACSDALLWQRYGKVSVAVNISPRQLAMPKECVGSLNRLLRSTQLPPELLQLEVTESVLLKDLPQTVSLLRKISEMGVSLSIDDFGTGYSALSYLRRYPFDTLKIDQSFVHDMLTNAETSALVKAMLAMANALQLDCVAEGVEKLEQAEFLKANNCTFAQGFYFGESIPADELTRMLSEQTQFTI